MLCSQVFAKSISFEPYITIWDCPKGAAYPVMQCEEHTREYGPVSIDMELATEDLWIARWNETSEFVKMAYGDMSVILYPNDKGEMRMNMIFAAGWSEHYELNSHIFLEGEQDHFSDAMMITSERIPNEDRELIISAGFQKFKFSH